MKLCFIYSFIAFLLTCVPINSSVVGSSLNFDMFSLGRDAANSPIIGMFFSIHVYSCY